MKIYTDYTELNSIKFEEMWIPKDPSNRHYQQFLEEQAKGEAELVPYVPPTPTWEQIRAERDQLLKESDWTQFPDAQPKPSKIAWLTYRQNLRDITVNFSSPSNVVWPTKPE